MPICPHLASRPPRPCQLPQLINHSHQEYRVKEGRDGKKNPHNLDNFFCTSFEVSCTFNLWFSAGLNSFTFNGYGQRLAPYGMCTQAGIQRHLSSAHLMDSWPRRKESPCWPVPYSCSMLPRSSCCVGCLQDHHTCPLLPSSTLSHTLRHTQQREHVCTHIDTQRHMCEHTCNSYDL